jgi:hypothetical protein
MGTILSKFSLIVIPFIGLKRGAKKVTATFDTPDKLDRLKHLTLHNDNAIRLLRTGSCIVFVPDDEAFTKFLSAKAYSFLRICYKIEHQI